MQLAEFKSYHPEEADRLAGKLDDLLIDFKVFQENVRHFHWNKRLRFFLELGPRLAILDHVTHENTSKVAEHLIELGYTPETQSELPGLSYSHVRPIDAIPHSLTPSLEALILSCEELLETVEEVWNIAMDINEPNTMELMAGFVMQLKYAIHVFGSTRLAFNN